MEASVIPLRKVASLKSLSTATSMLKRKTRALRYWTLRKLIYVNIPSRSALDFCAPKVASCLR